MILTLTLDTEHGGPKHTVVYHVGFWSNPEEELLGVVANAAKKCYLELGTKKAPDRTICDALAAAVEMGFNEGAITVHEEEQMQQLLVSLRALLNQEVNNATP